MQNFHEKRGEYICVSTESLNVISSCSFGPFLSRHRKTGWGEEW